MIQHHCENELSCEAKEVLTKRINEAFDFGKLKDKFENTRFEMKMN